jgi:BirA family biotin operon repressor/biotin-[acetyl-CoA-carboxylase] ligase
LNTSPPDSPADSKATADLEPEAIHAALIDTPFASGLHHFRTIGSTNTHALEQARMGAPHGSFYVADEQTAGRGRSDHQWHSAASEGLYLSILLRTELRAADLTWLPLITGLAVHSAIREVTNLNADLRWPNDILINNRKVAGILVEAKNSVEQGGTKPGVAVVIGIGINLHQQSFPSGLATEPTSLDLETGCHTSRQSLLIALLQSLQKELASIQTAGNGASAFAEIPSRIAAISTWVRGRHVEVHGPQPCIGITEGLDAQGFLRVRTDGGLVPVTTGGIRAIAKEDAQIR